MMPTTYEIREFLRREIRELVYIKARASDSAVRDWLGYRIQSLNEFLIRMEGRSIL